MSVQAKPMPLNQLLAGFKPKPKKAESKPRLASGYAEAKRAAGKR